MLAGTSYAHSLKDFRAVPPGKIEVKNEKIRARPLACVDLIKNIYRFFPVRDYEDFTRHLMFFKRLFH